MGKVNARIGFLQRLMVGLAWLVLGSTFALVTTASVAEQEHKTVKEVVYRLNHLTDGNDLITIDELKEILLSRYQMDFVGVEVERVDLQDVERVLRGEAFIVDAHAYLDAHEVLHVDVSQRTPILRVMDKKGHNYYLDCEGVRLPLSQHFTARVPVILGAVSDYEKGFSMEDNTLSAAFNVILQSRKDPFVGAWLESIYVQNSTDMLLSGNVGKFKVVFGDDQHIEEKFRKLKVFLTKGVKHTGWNQIESINLKFENQIVTKPLTKT